MVALINPNSQSSAIRQSWLLMHSINIFALATAVPLWFTTPFLTRNPESNGWHKFFRLSSVGYAILASGTSLYLSNQLGKLKPKIDALNKREAAEFKHTIATDIYLAQGTNSAIAQFLLAERQSSLAEPISELLNSNVHGQFNESELSVQNSSELGELSSSTVQNSSVNRSGNDLSDLAQEHFDAVIDALEDGYSDSKIIKDILGFKNYKYQQGKAILQEIKTFLNLED